MDSDDSLRAGSLLITNVRVFDGVEITEDDSVLVRDGVIEQVGIGITATPDLITVDGGGGTLLPGLIDAHTHVTAASDLAIALAFGVTTELDMFCTTELLAEVRTSTRGRTDHADLRSAGVGAAAPGGHPSQLVQWGIYPAFPTVASIDQVDAFVADRVAEGADYLKILLEDGQTFGIETPALEPEVVRALVVAGRAAGLLTISHVSTHADADLAIDAGVDGLAHLFIDRPPDADFARRAADAGIFVTPTLTVFEAFTGGARREAAFVDHPRLGPYLDPRSRASVIPDPDQSFQMTPPAGVSHEHAFAGTAALRQAGVPILAGTDAATGRSAHGFCLHAELAALVDAGLSPAEALRAATAAPAEAFGLADRGRIEAGRSADLLLVDGDPTADITATREIREIWRQGVRFDREAHRKAFNV
ncbi:amidohydrolase family protein [Microlunatus speluncae]|uniref:amidohydrolase family protein n=1 Tax=Microlunatus speluncae TaxID=2594267 RepID=UPI001C2D0FDA|nr:amidohydrolase family protein [Microlunatus speluncae]